MNELNGRIVDATNEIEVLKSASRFETSPIQSELDNAHTTKDSATDEALKDCDEEALQAAVAELAEVRELCRVQKEELEQKEKKIKTLHGIISDLNSDLNFVRVTERDLQKEMSAMNAILMASNQSQELMAANAAVMTHDLAEACEKCSILEEKCHTQERELSEMRTEQSLLKVEMQRKQHQHEELESLCATQKSAIADNEKQRALPVAGVTESDALRELRAQLTIKKLSEDSILLGEIKELEDEVARLYNIEELNEELSASLSEAKGETSRLIREKEDITENYLASSQRLDVSYCAEVKKLEEIVLDVYKEMLNIQTEQGFIEKIQNRMTAANIKWDERSHHDRDFLHLIDSESASILSTDPNTAGEGHGISDIDRLLKESEEALLRVKEKRDEFHQSQQSKRATLDKIGSGKEKGSCRKRESSLQYAMKNEFKEDLFKSEVDPSVKEGGRVSERVPQTENGEHSPFRLHCVGEATCDAFDRSVLETVRNSTGMMSEANAKEKERGSASDDQQNDLTSDNIRGHEPGPVERTSVMEAFSAAEKQKFENRTKLLLKSLGMFDDAYSNFMSCSDQTDEKWEEAVRIYSDAERRKMMTLKSCLMRLSAKLTPDELYDLEDFGIFLAPRGSQSNSGLRLGSALCFV